MDLGTRRARCKNWRKKDPVSGGLDGDECGSETPRQPCTQSELARLVINWALESYCEEEGWARVLLHKQKIR